MTSEFYFKDDDCCLAVLDCTRSIVLRAMQIKSSRTVHTVHTKTCVLRCTYTIHPRHISLLKKKDSLYQFYHLSGEMCGLTHSMHCLKTTRPRNCLFHECANAPSTSISICRVSYRTAVMVQSVRSRLQRVAVWLLMAAMSQRCVRWSCHQ